MPGRCLWSSFWFGRSSSPSPHSSSSHASAGTSDNHREENLIHIAVFAGISGSGIQDAGFTLFFAGKRDDSASGFKEQAVEMRFRLKIKSLARKPQLIRMVQVAGMEELDSMLAQFVAQRLGKVRYNQRRRHPVL